MAPTIATNALSAAICKGVTEGNASLVQAILGQSDKRHDLRNAVQQNADKVWEVDGELKLLKGIMVTLVGSGDGSTGMVPRLEVDMKKLGGDMASLKVEISEVRSDVGVINRNIESIMNAQSIQKSWTDGWKGVGVAIGSIAACITVIGGVIGVVVWLFTHGVRS
jgi:hypothetical protein